MRERLTPVKASEIDTSCVEALFVNEAPLLPVLLPLSGVHVN